MSEFPFHNARLLKNCSAKIADFLGEFRVDNNYIYNI